MKKNGLTFIAEIGLNHNGNFDLCFELIKQAKFAGADIVKFQLGWRDKPNEINQLDKQKISKLIEWANYFEIEILFLIISDKACELVIPFNFNKFKIASRTIKYDMPLVKKILDRKKVNPNSEFMRDSDGKIFVSKGRLPCEQPYQRMLVTYDGRVSMCCYDWGSMHPVGYVDQLAIDIGEKEYEKVKKKADLKTKGFDLMNLEMPKIFNQPKKKVRTIEEIWFVDDINNVRTKHSKNLLEEVPIFKNCPFKETYNWEKIN